MGKVIVNGVEYHGISDIRSKFGLIELCKNGWYEDSVTVNNPIIILQNGSASHVHAYDSAYVKSGKINQISSHEGYFDNVDFVTEVYYNRNGYIPDIDLCISSKNFKKGFTPIICSGKFDEINAMVAYPNLYALSCIVLSTRGCVEMVSASNIVYSRVSPLIGFTGLIARCPTF